MRDGLHTLCGKTVWVEDGLIRRGLKFDELGQPLPACLYAPDRRQGGAYRVDSMTPAAFCARVRRGTVLLT